MKALLSGSLFGLVGGISAYFLVRWLAPEMLPSQFANLIGVAAVGSGVLASAFSNWIATRSHKKDEN
jgi:uncharacterized membrane protein YfcA